MNFYGRAMRFAALESAGFALQLSGSRLLNFELIFFPQSFFLQNFAKFSKFSKFLKNSKAKSKFKNLLPESCRAKPADCNAENRIALPSKLTEIYNFWEIRKKHKITTTKLYVSNRKIGMNKYVLELRFLFVCKISEMYMQ